jgi:Tol biopolymer transport system component
VSGAGRIQRLRRRGAFLGQRSGMSLEPEAVGLRADTVGRCFWTSREYGERVALRVRLAVEIGVPIVLALSSAAACGSSSEEAADAKGLVTFSMSGDVYVMRADGSAQRRLTRSRANDFAPAGSPDGGRIAFTSDRDGRFEVYVMNVDGSAQRRLTSKRANAFPAWSPDGRKIAFVSDRDGNLELYVMNANGSEQRRLTRNPGVDGSPAWSPNGQSIACGCERDGNFDIYVIAADGRAGRRLTRDPRVDADPSWAPDGERIAFESKRSGSFEIYVIAARGGDQRKVTRSGSGADPAWSPDGRAIAFVPNGRVFVMQADGQGSRRLTGSGDEAGFPGWLPQARK